MLRPVIDVGSTGDCWKGEEIRTTHQGQKCGRRSSTKACVCLCALLHEMEPSNQIRSWRKVDCSFFSFAWAVVVGSGLNFARTQQMKDLIAGPRGNEREVIKAKEDNVNFRKFQEKSQLEWSIGKPLS